MAGSTDERLPRVDSAPRRLLVVGILLVAQGGLAVAFGAQPVRPEAGVYAGPRELATAPDAHVGERVETYGTVVDTDPLRIRLEYGERPPTVSVVGLETSAREGDGVRVFGTLESGDRIRADRGFAVPRANTLYAIAISALAALWVLWRFLRDWTVAPGTLAVSPRDRPVGEWLRELYGGER